jgi:hypothetical protein
MYLIVIKILNKVYKKLNLMLMVLLAKFFTLENIKIQKANLLLKS